MTPILILAAGASSRMRGGDKLLEQIDGVPLIRRVARAAVRTGHPVFAAIPGPWHPRYDLLKGESVICFDVPESAEGMGGTLRGAVKRLPPCDAIMILLSDLPEIETADIEAIFAARRRSPDALIWRGATASGVPGHPILFDASLRPEFDHLHGDDGGKSIAKGMEKKTILVPLSGERARVDLDTPEDWAAWRSANC